MVKLWLDAGHGGKDSGAIGNGLYEKNVALDLSLRIENKLNEYKNVEIMQSRKTDVFLTLSERTNKANQWGADCFISIHLNASAYLTAKGFETFIYNGSVSPETIAFQNVLHQEILKQIGNDVVNRGTKRANFHVLRETNMIALLGENLFVSNSNDASLMKQDSFLNRLAEGYAVGLEKFYGLERIIRPPTDEPITGEKLYQVIAGTFADYDNAISQVEKLKADGYSSYIKEK